MTTPAISERAELDYYTQRNANLLVHDEVLSETSKYEHNKDYIYWSIGKMACNLVEVGEDEAAQHLVEELLQAVNADEDATLRNMVFGRRKRFTNCRHKIAPGNAARPR